jgi:hypothetical protein
MWPEFPWRRNILKKNVQQRSKHLLKNSFVKFISCFAIKTTLSLHIPNVKPSNRLVCNGLKWDLVKRENFKIPFDPFELKNMLRPKIKGDYYLRVTFD